MSHPDYLFALITERPSISPSGQHNFESTYAMTAAAIADLPEAEANWPPLMRSMVAVPKAGEPLASFRGSRVISVAAHGNYLCHGLPDWLDKFEQRLLRHVLWGTATVYYTGGHLVPNLRIEYVASNDVIQRESTLEMPPTGWAFTVEEGKGYSNAASWNIDLPDFRTRPGYREREYPV